MWCIMIRMGDWVSPIPFTFMSINWGRRHTNMVWTQKPHTGWTEARNQVEALFTVREQRWKLSHQPPPSEKLLYNLVYCKRAHFIWFFLDIVRLGCGNVATRLQIQLCNMQFHTQFAVTKRPWTHQMLPQCSADRPTAGGVTHYWVGPGPLC